MIGVPLSYELVPAGKSHPAVAMFLQRMPTHKRRPKENNLNAQRLEKRASKTLVKIIRLILELRDNTGLVCQIFSF